MNEELAPEVKRELMGRWEPIYRSQLHYLVTWSTRGRRPVLRDRHVAALKSLILQACDERGITLVDAAVAHEHVHVLVALAPSHSVASVVRELKGRTAVAMLTQFPELRVWLRGNLVWDERYAVETVSAMRLDKVRERLRLMHGPDEELAAAS